jgi:tripartite-type tricarboxylate transporter receptor subunit TctC
MIGGAGPQLVTPAINSTVTYDTMRDFTHIAIVAGDSWMLAASPASGIKTFADFLTRAREAPLNCGSPGTGSQGHLLQEILNGKLGTKLQQVPYRGSGEAMNDLIGGHVPTALQPSIGVGEHVKAKTAIGLAVSTPTRLPAYPDVPTFKELGQDIQITSWFWLAGPKDLPAEIVTRLNQEIRRIVTLPQIKAQFDTRALSTLDLDAAQTRAHIAEEVALWRSVAKDSGIKVN